jgi:myo-inositol-1(or 4)-monophosphatase
MNSLLPAMEKAARVAGGLLMNRLLHLSELKVEAKGLNDFVTAADREAEEAIVASLDESWPGIPFLAEESAGRKTEAGERWIVDPLDGTTNFIHGYPFFSVSIAHESAGAIQHGVVFDPSRDEMFAGSREGGSTLNGKSMCVSGRGDLSGSLLVTGFPFKELARLEEYLEGFRRLLQVSAGVRRDGSAALDLAWVAAGRSDGFWEMGLAPWDVAAGGLLVQEAGGKVSDYSGGPDWLEGRSIVASTPDLHEAMRCAVVGTA